MTNTGDTWITVGEAADRLGVSKQTVRRRIADKAIKARWTRPPNRGWRQVSEASVDAYRRQMDGEAEAETSEKP